MIDILPTMLTQQFLPGKDFKIHMYGTVRYSHVYFKEQLYSNATNENDNETTRDFFTKTNQIK